MRSSSFALALALVLAFASSALATEEVAQESQAEATAAAEAGSGEPSTAADADSAEPSTAADGATAAGAEASEAAQATARSVVLGPRGRDARGRTGRIHMVETGDTLWDLSDAYLGTPWVWPSIWNDNGAIEDPDTIHPGERIWITPEEMRRVTAEEAAEMIAAGEGGAFPADLEIDGIPGEAPPETFTYAARQTAGFVSRDEVRGEATIVDGPTDRALISSPDPVLIGLGAGQVEVGDEFEIFRTNARVFDPDSGLFIGFSTQELGWLEVTDVHPESATAIVRLAQGEIGRGDHLRPRQPVGSEIALRPPPEVEGRVVYTPASRLNMATYDVVYLDRGAGDGLEVGSPLEVYRALGTAQDDVQGSVALPDHVIAKLLVIEAREESAVAVVTHTRGELMRGDHFRGSPSIAPEDAFTR